MVGSLLSAVRVLFVVVCCAVAGPAEQARQTRQLPGVTHHWTTNHWTGLDWTGLES